jgi:16S rRNA (guanine966-N2)-methyltransferase
LKPTKNNTFQVISGQHRGRKFNFPDALELRPTPNKVRETLFNWLQFEIQNKHCLDLFAGSGALGFEAISRGASQLLSIEKNPQAYQAIQENIKHLSTYKIQALNQDAFNFLACNTQVFDIIFLDPPFHQNLLEQTLNQLQHSIHSNTKIYLESEFLITPNICQKPFTLLKQKQAASVHYSLIQFNTLL